MNLIGKEVGDYIVVSFDDTKGKYKYFWNCECKNCKQMKSYEQNMILRYDLRCKNCNKNFGTREVLGYKEDITGQTFGKLTAISFVGKNCSHSVWKCRCECGNFVDREVTKLKYKKSFQLCDDCLEYYKKIENVLLKENRTKDNEVILSFPRCKKENVYDFLDDGTVLINKRAIVDFEDYKLIKSIGGFVSIDTRGYAYFAYNTDIVYLHRLISDSKLSYHYLDGEEQICDHINGNKLDNRRSNLRIIDFKNNAINCGLRKDNTSGVKGVYWTKKLSKWQVCINYKNKKHYLGVYESFEDAVKVRKEAEKKYFKEYNREDD